MRGPGKRVNRHLYVHRAALENAVDRQGAEIVVEALRAIGSAASSRVNVIKIPEQLAYVSLLFYPDFETDPFPALAESWTWHQGGGVTYRTYGQSLNPPILHRKELLVPFDWPNRQTWADLTQASESIGLFEESKSIGFRLNWEREISLRGYRLDGYRLVPPINSLHHLTRERLAQQPWSREREWPTHCALAWVRRASATPPDRG